MSILEKYNNKVNRFEFEQERDIEYKKLSDLYENGTKKIQVLAMFINNKSRYGDSAVICTNGYNVNLPKHLLETVKEMIEDDEVVELANNGGLGVEIYSYNSKKWGKNYSVNFIELSPF